MNITILHLSDLHFGMEPGGEKVSTTTMAQRNNTLKGLAKTLQGLEKEWKPGIVVISGDIGWKGSASDYNTAGVWIKEHLLKGFGLKPEDLVLCPGNHDINRQATIGFFPPDKVEDAHTCLSIENLENPLRFFSAYESFCKEDLQIPPCKAGADEFYLFGYREVKGLRFIVLNSAWYCRGDKDTGKLWLGIPQLEVMKNAGQLLDPDRYDEDAITFTVFHHPREWFHEKEINSYSRKNTWEYLASHSHVILNGHVHGRFEKPGREADSAYQFKGGATYTGPDYRNNFSLLRIDLDERTLTRRGFEFDPGDPEYRWIDRKPDPYNLRKPKINVISPGREISVTTSEEEILLYREKADALHANLPVAGFVTQLKVPVDVEDIYVPLRAMLDLRGINEGFFADSADAETCLRDCEAASEIHLPDAFKEAARRGQKGIVVLGDPGSGKTTHMKRVLLACLRKDPVSIGLPREMLPVFLPLRNLRSTKHGLDAFIQDELSNPHLKMSEDFGERLLKRGNLLFLLDGLDEVADTRQRKKVSQWIMEAIIHNPSCRFVVTCRFAGYSPEVRLGFGFLEMHIRPLDEEQVERFVRNWYGIVEKGLSKDPEQAMGIAEEKADALLERLNESDFRAQKVYELTRNPLLLTNICLVHRHRGGLPKKRARLYEECIDVFLEHWREGKGLPVEMTAQQGRSVLQPAALWLHEEEGRTRATDAELAPYLEPALKKTGFQKVTAKDFLEAVRDQSGLLTGWNHKEFGFMHLGFQEYLAAREIRNQGFKDKKVVTELASHFGESWWQEISLLFLALEEPSFFEDYMKEVVKLPAFVQHREMVDMCLEEAAEVSLKPFVDLVMKPWGRDESLWKRQFAALQIVDTLASEELGQFYSQLKKHPYGPIRKWIESWADWSGSANVLNEKDGYEMLHIPGGTFFMGSPGDEEGRSKDEGPQHTVQVKEFLLGRFPVTNEEYKRFLKENADVSEPKYWADRKFNQARQPVVGVSWDDAQRYAKWAGMRLPTEAEWEFACRAGTITNYYSGNKETDLGRVGWFAGNSDGRLHSVGEKESNEFGLHDMHGNVWEWVEDDYHDDYQGAPTDGSAWIDSHRGSFRVLRGGSWFNGAGGCRSAYRGAYLPSGRDDNVGFRLARGQ